MFELFGSATVDKTELKNKLYKINKNPQLFCGFLF